MRSFRKLKDDRRRIYLALVGSVESKLRDLYGKRYSAGELNQAELAKKLEVSRSVISRRLNGSDNMTLKSIADLVWALGGCVEVDIFDPADRPEKNHIVTVRQNMAPALSVPRVIEAGTWQLGSDARVAVSGDARLVVN
ncbi:MAG: helix-turn-helix transcriptional regulator [Phenylobacterium sp.]|uniref:helix-turn-helix domain-containing protein n=1 Tax=Phenylobacterium sp. TaxID=1871053 RepID=UPI003BB4B4A7